jgi:hypothetical protein
MKEYKYLTQAGLIMLLLGLAGIIPLIMAGAGIEPIVQVPGLLEISMVAGVSLLFIGGMCAISGWVGYRDEISKMGRVRKFTYHGRIAAILGIISVLISATPLIPIILGIPAIALGYKAYKDQDLEYGEIGMGCGAIGIIVGIILIIIFAVWGA